MQLTSSSYWTGPGNITTHLSNLGFEMMKLKTGTKFSVMRTKQKFISNSTLSLQTCLSKREIWKLRRKRTANHRFISQMLQMTFSRSFTTPLKWSLWVTSHCSNRKYLRFFMKFSFSIWRHFIKWFKAILHYQMSIWLPSITTLIFTSNKLKDSWKR